MSQSALQAIVRQITQSLNLQDEAVRKVIALLDEGMTIPFIARYRKEQTGAMKDFQIQEVKKKYEQLQELQKRKKSILEAIEEQGKLSPELREKIIHCWESSTLEDLYLPFKRKKQTRAEKARTKGLEPLAKIIMSQRGQTPEACAKSFVKQGISIEDALNGASDIIAEWVSEHASYRQHIRKKYQKEAIISSKIIPKNKDKAEKYEMYFDHSEHAFRAPSHRILAILRGEQEDLLRVKLSVDEDDLIYRARRIFVRRENHLEESIDFITSSIKDALKRLILPSIENEIKNLLREKAELAAIEVFSNNLKDLLMAPPLGPKWILSLDPGFRTGCKMVVLDEQGALIEHLNIFPHPPQSRSLEAQEDIKRMLDHYPIQAIAIGDATAGIETYHWIKSWLKDADIQVYFISESGASVYSGSELARQEFPDHDITVRGAVSIGRRLIDPLSELIKIDPKSIGVGQYQHDINQTKLKESLDFTIEHCVNQVGVDLNTASPVLLQYVSGLGPKLSENIVNYRRKTGAFKSRKELMKVDKFGPKAFQQSAGFLRIKNAQNPLDGTAVHPERYNLLEKIAKDQRLGVSAIIRNEKALKEIPWKNYADKEVGLPTLNDIRAELLKPNLDPRGEAVEVTFDEGIKTIEDLRTGMILNGKVSNITKFGAFINLGIKESGLVHISEIADHYISDPREYLRIDQDVRVKLISVDLKKKRISLSIKQA